MRRSGWVAVAIFVAGITALAVWKSTTRTTSRTSASPRQDVVSRDAGEAGYADGGPTATRDTSETNPAGGDGDEPGDESTEEFLRSSRRFLEESRAARERAEKDLLPILEAVAAQRLSPPPEALAPERPTVEYALPRALAWLAAQQRADGGWDGGVEADALSTAVFASDPFLQRELAVPRMRLSLRTLRGGPMFEPSLTSSPRETGVALIGLGAMAVSSPRDGVVREFERSMARLLDMRNRDGAWGSTSREGSFEPVATGWAILGLLSANDVQESTVRDLDLPSVTWSVARDFPEGDMLRVTASLLRRRAEVDDSDDETIRRLATCLAGDLRTPRNRSLDEWYLGARALKPDWSEEWKEWSAAMTEAVLRSQRADGSWSDGGNDGVPHRIRATAVAVLCLRAAREP